MTSRFIGWTWWVDSGDRAALAAAKVCLRVAERSEKHAIKFDEKGETELGQISRDAAITLRDAAAILRDVDRLGPLMSFREFPYRLRKGETLEGIKAKVTSDQPKGLRCKLGWHAMKPVAYFDASGLLATLGEQVSAEMKSSIAGFGKFKSPLYQCQRCGTLAERFG